MGLDRKFVKVPAEEEINAALVEFQDGAPPGSQDEVVVWSALHQVIQGMWLGRIEMADVEDVGAFQDLEVKVTEVETGELEESAKKDFLMRQTRSMHTVLRQPSVLHVM